MSRARRLPGSVASRIGKDLFRGHMKWAKKWRADCAIGPSRGPGGCARIHRVHIADDARRPSGRLGSRL